MSSENVARESKDDHRSYNNLFRTMENPWRWKKYKPCKLATIFTKISFRFLLYAFLDWNIEYWIGP